MEMENEMREILLLDEEFTPILVEQECSELQPILKEFMECYAENQDKPVKEWLSTKMQEQLPDRNSEEVQAMAEEIIKTLGVNEENKSSLEKAIQSGRSKESWFASEVQKSVSALSTQQTTEYLTTLDQAVQTANESLHHTITTQAGTVSQNPCLDGFIAEQHHAQTFNMNAVAKGSEYRAKVLEPNGSGYAKNSVDIVITDAGGKTVRRYQSKYCKDAEATAKAFAQGDYRGQQKLVPDGQQDAIQQKVTTVLEAPDGTTSKPLSKSAAKQMQQEAQAGKTKDFTWNEYQVKDLAMGIGKQAGYAALQGAAIGTGLEVAQKLLNGEEIKGEEVVETALVTGADFGVKAAAAGALKVGVEKNMIGMIPKGTPAGTIANIAHVAVENAKIVGKMATGELTVKEGIEKIEQTTVATVAGIATMGKGAAIGTTIGAVFGPIGAATGGLIGGTIGYVAGSEVGKTLVKGVQILREEIRETVSSIGNGLRSAVHTVSNAFSSGLQNVCSFFGL